MVRSKLLWTLLAALSLAIGGLVYAKQQTADGYTCPITGEQLPCEKCCPLNQSKETQQTSTTKDSDEGYVCPLTGETLPCPNCCPLNQKK